jgi:ABC-type Fe3+/spermidine/putrescine transport system ATPase subunit
VVELGGGAWLRAAATDEPITPGTAVQVAIRPEDLRIHEGAGENVLRCNVEKVLYLGAECELLLRFGDVAYTHVVSRSLLPEIGSTLDLYLPPSQLRVWPERGFAGALAAEAAPEALPGVAPSPAPAAG